MLTENIKGNNWVKAFVFLFFCLFCFIKAIPYFGLLSLLEFLVTIKDKKVQERYFLPDSISSVTAGMLLLLTRYVSGMTEIATSFCDLSYVIYPRNQPGSFGGFCKIQETGA